MDDIKKELRLTRFFCIVSSLLTLCLLAVIGLLAVKLQPIYLFIEEAKPALQQVKELDIGTMNRLLQDMETTVGQVDWNELADSLEQLDIEEINQSLQSLDMEELSAALEHINKAADTMESLSEKFSSFSSLFGR
ncbi:MAG: hypothetical protein NC417_02050 [Candidatus Gastranaerophilales bacterium]|nr:hypothetical protein [Candidatus Gastranaerophilales bacterium]